MKMIKLKKRFYPIDIYFVFALPVTKPEGTHGLFRPGITPDGTVSRLGAPKKSIKSPADRKVKRIGSISTFWRLECTMYQCRNIQKHTQRNHNKTSSFVCLKIF